MKALLIRGIGCAAALALAGCAAQTGGGRPGGVDITRMHLGQPIARAQIAVEPANAAQANSPEFQAFEAAVERHLVRHGYAIAPNRATSEQIARVDVRQGSRASLTTGWPAGLSPASRSGNMVATLLDVRIQRRSDGTVFWQGRAVTETATNVARPTVVERLANALFRDFPGESGRTIRVR